MTLQLLHGDCLELMKTLPDKSIDLFICDLPYGCLSTGNSKRKRFINGVDTGTILEGQTIGGCNWDIKIDLEQFWTQVKRLAKNDHTPVIHFCNSRFGFELYNSNPSWFRYDLVWAKCRKVGFLSANKQPLRSHENIYIFSKKGAYYKRIDVEEDFPSWVDNKKRCVGSVVEVEGTMNKGRHPTEKPIDLYKWLISRYCPEGGTVLDPTAGSFNSGIASVDLKLNYIGIEKDDTFFEKGKERFNQSSSED